MPARSRRARAPVLGRTLARRRRERERRPRLPREGARTRSRGRRRRRRLSSLRDATALARRTGASRRNRSLARGGSRLVARLRSLSVLTLAGNAAAGDAIAASL